MRSICLASIECNNNDNKTLVLSLTTHVYLPMHDNSLQLTCRKRNNFTVEA